MAMKMQFCGLRPEFVDQKKSCQTQIGHKLLETNATGLKTLPECLLSILTAPKNLSHIFGLSSGDTPPSPPPHVSGSIVAYLLSWSFDTHRWGFYSPVFWCSCCHSLFSGKWWLKLLCWQQDRVLDFIPQLTFTSTCNNCTYSYFTNMCH